MTPAQVRARIEKTKNKIQMNDLSEFRFTNSRDVAWGVNGWYIRQPGVVSTLAGDDLIVGSNMGSFGYYEYYGLCAIENAGIIITGEGADSISGTIGVKADRSQPCYGIINRRWARIDMGNGNDAITGAGLSDSDYGILNQGSIDTGEGDDLVSGRVGSAFGEGSAAFGISNAYGANINTGSGNDLIKGSILSVAYRGSGIFNDGIIDAGDGDDTVDALYGGFSGSGETILGAGNDTLRGFGRGQGKFLGGEGIDTIVLPSGTYSIRALPRPKDRLMFGMRDVKGIGMFGGFIMRVLVSPPPTYVINESMTISGFETFGAGSSISSVSDAAKAGSFVFA